MLHEAVRLTEADILAVQQQVRRRGLRWLSRHGYLDSAAVYPTGPWITAAEFEFGQTAGTDDWPQMDQMASRDDDGWG